MQQDQGSSGAILMAGQAVRLLPMQHENALARQAAAGRTDALPLPAPGQGAGPGGDGETGTGSGW